ncbi:hypothetical protein Bca4012_071988 [Brassica carinata]|uniref:Uncharacterized protein n=1 Tax=Brassica carinata TaxID=52824 RepID=A0A8X7QJQ7_BRACI|nr:hypothetical protein Bca52824_064430 [Brassica carinata]
MFNRKDTCDLFSQFTTSSRCVWGESKLSTLYRCDTRQVDDRERSQSSHQNVTVTRKLAGEDDHLDPLLDLNQRRPLSCYNNLTMICSSL